MPVLGTPRTFDKKWKFIVEIDSFSYAGFSKCSELSAEVASIEHREGGVLIPNKSPGLMTVADITLERGATSDFSLYQWFSDVARASSNRGLADPGFRRNLDIVQQDLDGETLKRWNVVGAWPKKFVAGEWDNDADEVVLESVTLAIDYFELVP
jgi:phage tail-like protein